jgi:SAM-dependent methyltransferase
MLDQFAWNPWFLNSYWPENEPRIRLMAHLAQAHLSNGRRMLEVGCANGYVAYLFSLLGFDVSAVDAYEDERRAELFREGGILYQQSNLNDVPPLKGIPANSFDIVFLGEVFEHILNEPAGLLKRIHEILRPGGLIILTTPNPSTLINAARLLRDNYVLWGTREFLMETKLDGRKIIDNGNIHYREYPGWLIKGLLTELGYGAFKITYVSSGIAPTHPLTKRWSKQLLLLFGLCHLRLFASGYIISATKNA